MDTATKVVGYTVLTLIGTILLGFFISSFLDSERESRENVEVAPWNDKPWKELLLPNKKRYLEAIQDKEIDRWHDVRRVVKGLVKKQANFPEELEFQDECYYVVDCMRITSYSDGHAVFTGEVVGKNAFGVKQRVTYEIKLAITPNDIELVNAELHD